MLPLDTLVDVIAFDKTTGKQKRKKMTFGDYKKLPLSKKFKYQAYQVGFLTPEKQNGNNIN